MTMQRLKNLLTDSHGSVAVLLALAAVVVMGFTALAIDVGILLNERRVLVTAADAGALAGAQTLSPENPNVTNQQAAESEAVQVATLNEPDVDGVVVSADMNQLLVTVKVTRTVPLTFARVLGIESLPVSAMAVAEKRPVQVPVEAILPLAIRDPRYAPNGQFCDPTVDSDGNGIPDAACDIDGDGTWDGPFDADTPLDRTIWEMVDEANGGNDGYIELRYEPGGGDMGNFSPLDLDTPYTSDPCYAMAGAALYECQLNHGGYVDPYAATLELYTQTGNMPNATYDGILERLARAAALGDPACTPEAIARRSEALNDTTVSQSVVGRPASSACPLVVPIPLIRQWPPGSSTTVQVTTWVAFGIINICNAYGSDPFATTGVDACRQIPTSAIIISKWLPGVNITALAAPVGTSPGMTYTVKLIK